MVALTIIAIAFVSPIVFCALLMWLWGGPEDRQDFFGQD